MGTDTEIGWGWLTSPSFDGTGAQTWHNGATGGFRTFLTLDLAAGTGFLILSNSVAPVEDVVLAYATGSSIPGPCFCCGSADRGSRWVAGYGAWHWPPLSPLRQY